MVEKVGHLTKESHSSIRITYNLKDKLNKHKRCEILTMIKEIKLFNQKMLEVLEYKKEKLIRSTQTKKILPRQNNLPLWPHLYVKKT